MIEGKVAVVTGGSRGMGAIIAEKLAQEGADVAVIYVGKIRMRTLTQQVYNFFPTGRKAAHGASESLTKRAGEDIDPEIGRAHV